MPDPAPLVYLNGRFLPRRAATLDVEDRGTLFGDGVYEVLRYYGGKALAMSAHLTRLRNSLAGIRLPEPAEFGRLTALSDELVARHGWREAKVYWQITRGPAPRDHAFPQGVAPTVLMLASPLAPLDLAAPPRTTPAILAADERWHRCCIKSLMLLPNVLAKHAARATGAGDAILHRGPIVTEATAANVFMVRDGEVWTHPADQWILPGVTRGLVVELARAGGAPVPLREETFTVDDLRAAREVFLTGTTTQITAVTAVDGRPVGAGQVGAVTARLHALLLRRIAQECAL